MMTEKSQRPGFDEYFMRIATEVATRSTCNRRHVGAVLAKNKRIVTTGYNGSPVGTEHCSEAGCIIEHRKNGENEGPHCVRTVHAEENALLQAALHGVSTDGATMYTTAQPCVACAKHLINAGVKRVVFAGHYPDELAMKFLNAAGIELVKFDAEVLKKKHIDGLCF